MWQRQSEYQPYHWQHWCVLPVRTLFRYLNEAGYKPEFRFRDDGDILQTDSGNYLIDITIPDDADLAKLAHNLKNYTGVVEHGLFLNICDQLIIGGDKVRVIDRPKEETKK